MSILTTEQVTNLLSEIRSEFDITWDDAAQDKNLRGYIMRGAERICRLCLAEPKEFTEEGATKQMLFDYCRYAWNKCLEDWETNFKYSILELRTKNRVRNKEQSDDNSE